MNINDYIPFTGGYAWSNPYEITRYERKLSYTDGHECEMEILCRGNKEYFNLYNFIELWIKTNLICVTMDAVSNSRIRINIKTHHQSITDKIKDFVDKANRPSQTEPSDNLVFQYGHDVIPLGQVGEVKINPKGIEFTCNVGRKNEKMNIKNIKNIKDIFDSMTEEQKNVVYFMVDQAVEGIKVNIGRKNGKSMASKDLVDALVYFYFYAEKDAKLTKEMTNNMIGFKLFPVPKKIIFSGPKCIVLWPDGTKTIVSCSENDQWDEYAAYCAALAKKIYGTTSAVHRMVDKKSNAKEYREAQEVSTHIDAAHSFEKIIAEAMRKAMKPFIEEDNDEHSEH